MVTYSISRRPTIYGREGTVTVWLQLSRQNCGPLHVTVPQTYSAVVSEHPTQPKRWEGKK